MGKVEETVKKVVPDFIFESSGTLKRLAALGAGAITVLINFAENPVGYVVEILLETFVGALLWAAGYVGLFVTTLWDAFTSALIGSLSAAFGPVGSEIGGLIVDGITGTNDIIRGFVDASGPLGLFVAIVLYGAVLYVIGWSLREFAKQGYLLVVRRF